MKPKKFATGLLFMLLLTAACSKDTTASKENPKKNVETYKKSDSNNKLPDLKNYSLDYNFDTDAQPFFAWGRAAKSENGYYLVDGTKNGGNLLMFYDCASQKFVPVCNRPNCKHEDETCNAYISSYGGETGYIDPNYIQCYDRAIYMVGYDKEHYVSLYKIALDGSTRETYMKLYKRDSLDSWNLPEVCIHRDYVYFIDKKEKLPKICRMKLGEKETETIYETSGKRPTLYRMEAYGDYLFFQAGKYTDEKCLEVKGGIYAYNIQNGDILFVKENAISSYTIYDSQIYYSDKKEIRKMSIQTGEDEKLLDYLDGYADISVDQNYIYTFSFEGKMKFYEKESKDVVYEKNDLDSTELFFGDASFLFGKWLLTSEDGGAKEQLQVFDKSKLKWKTLVGKY